MVFSSFTWNSSCFVFCQYTCFAVILNILIPQSVVFLCSRLHNCFHPSLCALSSFPCAWCFPLSSSFSLLFFTELLSKFIVVTFGSPITLDFLLFLLYVDRKFLGKMTWPIFTSFTFYLLFIYCHKIMKTLQYLIFDPKWVIFLCV